jgi:hypothetical protein
MPQLIFSFASGADSNWLAKPIDSEWSNPKNWQGGIIADGSGFTANFLTDINFSQTVTVDATGRTIGIMKFSDTDYVATPGDWYLQGGVLNLAGAAPQVDVAGPTRLWLYNTLRADAGFTKTGSGRVFVFVPRVSRDEVGKLSVFYICLYYYKKLV